MFQARKASVEEKHMDGLKTASERVFFPCEPRGPVWDRYPPSYRSLAIWLYRDGVECGLIGWEHVEIIMPLIFANIEDVPSRNQIIKWYRENPKYPEELCKFGFPSPSDILAKRCREDASVKEYMEDLGMGKLLGKNSKFKTCEYTKGAHTSPVCAPQYLVSDYGWVSFPVWPLTITQLFCSLMVTFAFVVISINLASALIKDLS